MYDYIIIYCAHFRRIVLFNGCELVSAAGEKCGSLPGAGMKTQMEGKG